MNIKIQPYGIILAAAAVLLAACGRAAPAPATPTNDPAPVLTGVAQTAQVRLTEMALLSPSPLPDTPTPTATETPSPTSEATLDIDTTPGADGTPAPTSASPPPSGSTGDNGVLASETVADGTRFTPGTAFVKTWRMLNTGQTTWGTGYELVYVSDHQLSAPDKVSLPVNVPPGQVVDINVDMVAPNEHGTYKGFWRLRNPAGQFFGDLIWIEIVVGETASTPPPSSATATATQTNGGATVSNVTVSLDDDDVTATCPHNFTISASFTLSSASSVTYQLEAGSEIPGFQFTLPSAQTGNFGAGTHFLTFSLSISDTGSGWIRLRISAPQDVTSSPVNFSLTCQ
jgi:hypothetical protein